MLSATRIGPQIFSIHGSTTRMSLSLEELDVVFAWLPLLVFRQSLPGLAQHIRQLLYKQVWAWIISF